ncbi:MAG: NAD(P)/FAD-dependent oxidoreductase [Candidatus Omnitrophota bacterium]
MRVYNVAIAGAGAAGLMAAIRAGQLNERIVLIEKNNRVGKKILLTGNGRCNITNIADIDTFIKKFGENGRFFRTAFSVFFNQDVMNFFKLCGLDLKVERQGKVFPVTEQAESVVEVFEKCLSREKVEVLYNSRVADIKKQNDIFELRLENNDTIYAKKVILASGGASYKETGSSGDGFDIAEKLGHSIISLKPALVPLKTKEVWVKKLQGISLKDVKVTWGYGNKKNVSEIGEMIFTHFGISGPLILDLSGEIVLALNKEKEISLCIDFEPAFIPEQLEKRLLAEFDTAQNAQLKNVMKTLLPQRLIDVFLDIAGLPAEKKANQISRAERHIVIKFLKAFPLTITSALKLECAMVTNGGISTKEINPRTMESKIVQGLYFAGEIIDGCAPSGGYNLQQAFSTGWLAGEKASVL